ncbi:MAG: patatin-like phospholipase family protein [Gemmatimonadota bacterium]
MRHSAFAFILCLIPVAAAAQQALVLSGGGSRGIAHVGVLLMLEERGYDPDIVVGTSMGAVVGALYAAGYEPEAIRDQITNVEWRGMFEPTPGVIGIERAIRYPMLAIDLSVARFRFSRGLVGQWRINRALAALLFDANARSRGDFDKLPRRYRAIAVDLKTGQPTALDHGDLALAARASMAVPGFFAPVVWDERVLIDGGVAANLPTEFARKLGAEYLIAVDVARPPPNVHSNAPLDVVQRALDHMQSHAQKDTVRPDVLVQPDMPPGLSGATFPADPTPLIEIGRAAALRDLPQTRAVFARVPRAAQAPPDSFAAVVFEAPDSALAGLANALFREVAARSYDVASVTHALDRLYATGLFEAVWPRVEQRGTDQHPTMVVRLVGQPKVSLTAAAHYENDRGGRAWGSIDRYSMFARRPAVWSAAASLGGLERSAALSTRVFSSRAAGLAWSLGAYAQERQVRFFDEDVIGSKEVLRTGGWLALELPHILRKRFAVGGLRAEWIDLEDGASGFAVGPLVRWASVKPPASVVGIPFTLEAERRWGDFTYSRVTVSGSRTLELRGWQIAALGDVRVTRGDTPPDVQPSLGDDHMIPGFVWGERRDASRVVAGVDVAYPFYAGFIRLRTRSGAVGADLEETLDAGRWIGGAQLGIILPTPLGALEAGYGYATRGSGRFDVSIGQRF